MNAQVQPQTQQPLWLRELARDIHFALADDRPELSTSEHHAMRETILRVLATDRRASALVRAPQSAPTAPTAPAFNPRAFGLACTVAWTELAQALRADGHDVKDCSGPTVRKWMEGIVRDTFAAPAQASLHNRVYKALADLVKLRQPEGAKVKWRDELIDREAVVRIVMALKRDMEALPAPKPRRPIPDGYTVICSAELARLRERDEPVEGALERFTAYFVKNYPGPMTIISDPYWHAPRLFRAAQYALATTASEGATLER